LKQSDLSGELLARNIRELIENPQRLELMSANSARLAPKDAAGRVANTIEKYTTHEARV
jgi:UDP-N-acetylglucosamine:LPS N-acetylglucosamine transferase